MVLGSNNPFAPSVGSFQVPVTPPDSDPDEGQQVTVCFSADWLPFVIGSLQQLTLQATWAGDEDAVLLAQDRAQLLIAMFGGVVGGCSESVCIGGLRYDSDCDCIMQEGNGGTTETENPDADPRHSDVFRFPVIDADDPKCQAASNMTRWLNDLIDQVLLTVDAAGSAEGLMAIVLPFVVELGPFGLLIELVLGVAFLLFSAGATAISAAFTNEVYDMLTCIFYCRIDDEGQVSADALALILSDIDAQIGGLVSTILSAMFFLTGEVGLSNAGTIGSAPADCSGCSCLPWPRQFDFCGDLDSWSITCGTLTADGVASVNSCEGSPSIIYITRNITIPTGSAITEVWWYVEGTPSTGDQADLYWQGSLITNLVNPTFREPFVTNGFSLTGTGDMLIIWQRSTTGSDNRIPTVRLYGTGTPPDIGHDEIDPPCL